MSPKSKLILGTRGSPLALAQAHMVRRLLAASLARPEDSIEVLVLKTSGDRIQDRPLSEVGGKGLFTRELDEALEDGRIDLAVHSMKDVPTRLPDFMALAAVLPREDVRDRLLGAASIAGLAPGARVGTSSLRRGAQMKAARPDLVIVPFRGNVETRLAKLERGEADATLLAAAGLNRLGMGHVGTPVPVDVLLPAPAQGAVGVTVRADDTPLRAAVAVLDHAPTAICVAAERAFLAALDGSCRTPIAGWARLGADGGRLTFSGQVLTPDGAHDVAGERVGSPADAAAIGADLAADLKARGGPAITALFG
ncbi:hydroxymethylbilane synthase [Parapedomonas caeni]